MQENKIIDILDKLENNAIFRLSLTSKELFHSNFWAWLLSKYPQKFTSVFYLNYDNKSPVVVRREKNNFDLSIEINNRLIIIENKFKSLPNKKQLEEYLKKAEQWAKKEIILISYIPPSFEMDISNSSYFSYKELYERLEKIELSDINSTDRAIIENYIECIKLLCELQCSELTDFDTLEAFWNLYSQKDVQGKLDEINFGLTLQRNFMGQLANKLLSKIKLNNLNFQIMTGNSHVAYIDFWLPNSEASVSLCCNGEYRYVFNIKRNPNDTKDNLIEKCKNKYGSFLSNKNCITGRKEYNCFMSKDNAWIYKKRDIKNKSFEDIALIIENDLTELAKI